MRPCRDDVQVQALFHRFDLDLHSRGIRLDDCNHVLLIQLDEPVHAPQIHLKHAVLVRSGQCAKSGRVSLVAQLVLVGNLDDLRDFFRAAGRMTAPGRLIQTPTSFR